MRESSEFTSHTGHTSSRPLVMGRNGAVSSGHPLASLAGHRILTQGGNAFDAAVAVATSLGVVEPAASGLGGDAFILLYDSSAGEVHCINATGPAPAGATSERFTDGIPGRGPVAASVPGAFSGLATLIERWGSLDLQAALQPAIELAEHGFPVGHRLANQIHEHQSIINDCRESFIVKCASDRSSSAYDILVQPDLAKTLKILAIDGHDAFYDGPVGSEIVEGVRHAGGLLDKESMSGFRAEVTGAICADYRGYSVFAPPPNSTGHVLLQELLMLEHFNPSEFQPLTIDGVHLMVEIKKLAFEDRERYNADPAFVDAFPQELLSSSYAKERLTHITKTSARPIVNQWSRASDDTTYFAVADSSGNGVSVTTSINGVFGSGFMPGRTGIFLNNRMRYWHLDSLHPNFLVPGKRVRHTVSPVIVMRDGRPSLLIGTPGADGQVQTILQVLSNIIDFDMNPQTAVEVPRWRSSSIGQESNYPHGSVDQLMIEVGFPQSTMSALSELGHNVVEVSRRPTFGSCQVIQVLPDAQKGYLFGAAADPRRDAYALAW